MQVQVLSSALPGGRIAQLVRAPRLHRGGPGFESLCAHMKFISISEKQTFNFAKKFSKELAGGEIIGLIGNLGAGKTVFTKGLAAGLGIKKNVASPTFVLMKAYPVAGHKQIKWLVHFDAYRVKTAGDLSAIGAKEYFNRPDTVSVIEWADKIKKILPQETKFFIISYKNNSRIIKF
jgi:tRNA threonylcarbamoyladenosine biosynthesis protein TsaE